MATANAAEEKTLLLTFSGVRAERTEDVQFLRGDYRGGRERIIRRPMEALNCMIREGVILRGKK